MIYNCWLCGHRIKERTTNSDLEVFPTKIPSEEVGCYVLFEHHPFCGAYCIAEYKKKYKGKKRPEVAPHADIYEEIWKRERRLVPKNKV